MTERPIIFSAPMVNAILERRKTQTRRILKVKKGTTLSDVLASAAPARSPGFVPIPRELIVEPVIQPGDRLWVRESVLISATHGDDVEVSYAAGGRFETGPCTGEIPDASLPGYFRMVDRAKKHPKRTIGLSPIFMPRWASRITLGVTDVRVMRLHDIDYHDAQAEGCGIRQFDLFGADSARRKEISQAYYHNLWDSIHGRGAWEANPWVCALTFRVEKDHGNPC